MVLLDLKCYLKREKMNKKNCINISKAADSLSPNFCNTLFILQVLTVCDMTSAFRGQGEVEVIEIVRKNNKKRQSLEMFIKLRELWKINEDTLSCIEELTLSVVIDGLIVMTIK